MFILSCVVLRNSLLFHIDRPWFHSSPVRSNDSSTGEPSRCPFKESFLFFITSCFLDRKTPFIASLNLWFEIGPLCASAISRSIMAREIFCYSVAETPLNIPRIAWRWPVGISVPLIVNNCCGEYNRRTILRAVFDVVSWRQETKSSGFLIPNLLAWWRISSWFDLLEKIFATSRNHCRASWSGIAKEEKNELCPLKWNLGQFVPSMETDESSLALQNFNHRANVQISLMYEQNLTSGFYGRMDWLRTEQLGSSAWMNS